MNYGNSTSIGTFVAVTRSCGTILHISFRGPILQVTFLCTKNAYIAHLSINDAQNTMGTKGTPE